MKQFLLFALTMCIGLSSFSQTAFTKKESSDGTRYLFDAILSVENGHGEPTNVTVSASIDKEVWVNFVTKEKASQDSLNKVYNKNYVVNDSTVFTFIFEMLSIKARGVLKNSASFVPLNKQFFTWYDKEKAFMSNYKMMGRNGYGNLIETQELVFYSPTK